MQTLHCRGLKERQGKGGDAIEPSTTKMGMRLNKGMHTLGVGMCCQGCRDAARRPMTQESPSGDRRDVL